MIALELFSQRHPDNPNRHVIWCCHAESATRCDHPPVTTMILWPYGELPACDQHAAEHWHQRIGTTEIVSPEWCPDHPTAWPHGPEGNPNPRGEPDW